MSKMLKKPSERQKIQEILDKIEDDSFTPSDIDLILIKLREYSKPKSLFQEISHFAAHNEIRDQGNTFYHMNGFFSSMLFHTKHSFDGKEPLDFSKPIPGYVIEKIKFNIHLSKDTFTEKYKCSLTQFESKFNNVFQKIKGTNTYKLKGTLKGTVRKVTEDMLQLLISQPLFTQEQIIEEFINVLKENQFSIDENLYKLRCEKIILFIVFLMHGTEYSITEEIKSISFIDINQEDDLRILSLNAHVPTPYKDTLITCVYPLISTKLDYLYHCSEKIIQSGINEKNRDMLIIKNRKLDF